MTCAVADRGGTSVLARRGGRPAHAAIGVERRVSGGEQHAPGHLRLLEIQRARLLAASLEVIDQVGWLDVTVRQITDRARVSRRTFYDLFDNRSDCLLATFEGAADDARAVLRESVNVGGSWVERVRRGLWALLSLFDQRPVFARVLVVQSARGDERGDERVLERRARLRAELARFIDHGAGERAKDNDALSLVAEGVVGGVHSIVHERLLRRDSRPLIELFGSLMAMIVLPYMGAAAARRQHALPAPSSLSVGASAGLGSALAEGFDGEPFAMVPMRLTYRTARVLECIARNPGVSNRQVGQFAGIADQGQASKLLKRLRGFGLVTNEGQGHAKGEPNAWRLTSVGERMARQIGSTSTDVGGAHASEGASEARATRKGR